MGLMALFGKKEVVYEVQGLKSKECWTAAQKKLKDAGIKIAKAASRDGESKLCGCSTAGDQKIYYIAVRPEDAETAKEVLRGG